MSYLNKMEYTIIPTNTFNIKRECAGCGCKQNFICKGNFRVNANGNRIDVWIIYGCEKCGHTYNLPIYERKKVSKLSKTEYQKFLENDGKTIFEYGTNKSVFAKNRAEIDWDSVGYKVISTEKYNFETENPLYIELNNPYNLPIRKEKIVAGILQISRKRVKELMESELLYIDVNNSAIKSQTII